MEIWTIILIIYPKMIENVYSVLKSCLSGPITDKIDLNFLDKNLKASLNFVRTLSTKSSLWVAICWKDTIARHCIIFGVTNLFLWDLKGDYNGLIRSYNFNICNELRYDLLQSSTPSNHFKDKETETQRSKMTCPKS